MWRPSPGSVGVDPGVRYLPAWAGSAVVQAVDSVGITVSDMDRSVRFFADVLGFEPVSDVEVAGEDYERLEGVFGLRMRVVRLRLGEEAIELTGYLAPRGRPIPPDARSNDRSFQHVAIIVSPGAVALRGRELGFTRGFLVRDPDGHVLQIVKVS